MYAFEAGGGLALLANEMDMVIMMVPIAAVVFAQGISHGVIGRRNGMYDAFFEERLQGAVYGDSVEPFTGFFLDICMRKRPTVGKKQLKDAPPASGNAKLVALQDHICFYFRHACLKVLITENIIGEPALTRRFF